MAGRVLYEENKIRVAYYGGSFEMHEISIGESPFVLGKGVLERLAKMKGAVFQRGLNSIHPNVSETLRTIGISYDLVSWAVTQARISELEKQCNDLLSE